MKRLKNRGVKFFVIISLIVFLIYSEQKLRFGISEKKFKSFQKSCFDESALYQNQIWPIEILSQRFFYYKKGKQAVVFISEDQKYVLKLFLAKKLNRKFRELFFFNEKTFRDRELRREKLSESINIALRDLKENCRIIYFHRVSEKGKLRLQCNFKEFEIDAEGGFFVLQKRVFPFESLQKSPQIAQTILRSFFDCVTMRVSKNINIRDGHNFLKNTGIDNGEFIEIDIGSFYKGHDMAKTEEYIEIFKREFLKAYPQFAREYDARYQDFLIAIKDMLKTSAPHDTQLDQAPPFLGSYPR